MNTEKPEISLVLPIFNEEESLQELFERVTKTMESLNQPYEVITIDDGSRDGSFRMLSDFHEQDKRWRVIRLTRNFGQSAAIYAGFSVSRGHYVIMIDADLQMYPEDIPLVYEKLTEGYDMVSGWRTNRKDNPFRRVMSRLLNIYTERVTGFPFHDHGCSLKGYRRTMVERMVAFTHRCRYLPVDAAMLGGNVAEVPVRHCPRQHGQSKYSVFKLFHFAFHMITTITIMPLQALSVLGIIFALIGTTVGAYVFFVYLLSGDLIALQTIIAVLFFLAGVQLFATGLMGEYVGRIYIETQRKPLFIIEKELD